MTKILLDNFSRSLGHLELQYANWKIADTREGLSQLDKEAIAESVIQRFETCYDCSWKALERYLMEGAGIPDIPNSPKPVFKIAASNMLLPGALEQWLDFANARVATAHDYSGTKMQGVLDLVPDFIVQAKALFEAIKQGGSL